jgi:hypothetical protein
MYECLRVPITHRIRGATCTISDFFDTYHLSESENLFFDAIGEGVALGIAANKKNEPIIATSWADFGWEVLEVAKGIGEGVVLGAYNTACFAKNIVCHPIRTTREIVHGLGTVICAAGKVVGIPMQLGALCITGDAEQAYKEAQEMYEQTKFLAQECATKIAAMSNREIAKHATAFATDWFLTEKALTFAYSICSRVGPLLAEAIEVLCKEPVIEYVVAGTEGMLHHISETTKHVGGAAKEIVKDFASGCKEELFKFAPTAAGRMEEVDRMIPIHILDEIVKHPLRVLPDPRGLPGSLMYYSRMWVNKKLYNVEVLYDKSTNTISHFLYRQDKLGPLSKIK